jgi:hypothetical protein
MKLTLPPPIAVKLPNGETIQYSAIDLVKHVVRNGREFARSNDLDRVRQGARILSAFDVSSGTASIQLLDQDATDLRAVLAKPSAGWSAIQVTMPVVTGMRPDGSEVKREVQRTFTISPLELLPMLDALLAS